MAPPEIYQEGKESKGGIWRVLGIILTFGVVLALINDAIALNPTKS